MVLVVENGGADGDKSHFQRFVSHRESAVSRFGNFVLDRTQRCQSLGSELWKGRLQNRGRFGFRQVSQQRKTRGSGKRRPSCTERLRTAQQVIAQDFIHNQNVLAG